MSVSWLLSRTMKLDKGQWSRIQQTLLDAFDRNNLRMMLRLELDVDLDTVAGDEDLATVVFNLIGWAERNNRVDDLLVGAAKYNPGNAGLQELAAEYPSWLAKSISSPGSPAPTTYPSVERSWGWTVIIGVVITAVLAVGVYLLWQNFGPDVLPETVDGNCDDGRGNGDGDADCHRIRTAAARNQHKQAAPTTLPHRALCPRLRMISMTARQSDGLAICNTGAYSLMRMTTTSIRDVRQIEATLLLSHLPKTRWQPGPIMRWTCVCAPWNR